MLRAFPERRSLSFCEQADRASRRRLECPSRVPQSLAQRC